MHVEDETSDRHGRIRAVADKIVPVAVTQFRHVHSKRRQQILRVPRRQLTRRKLRAQGDANRIVVVLPEQSCFQPVEEGELFRRGERRMVGDIVGGTHEFVEREDRCAMARVNDPRGHWEVLVPVALARPRFNGGDHHRSNPLACIRPFQLPPRPRTYWWAESRVKIMYCSAIAGSASPHNGESR